jgi:hypothetical protein
MGAVDIPFAAEPADSYCAGCGQRAGSGESFCARCGSALTQATGATASDVDSAPVPTAHASAVRRGRVLRMTALAIAAVFALAAIGALAFLWRGEIASHADTSASLVESQASVASLTTKNLVLQATLDETSALAARRAAVLLRAQRVLRQVTPLLSSVDAVQAVSLKMQESRGSYAGAAETLKSDLITLANYLLDVNPEYIDYGYVNSLIDSVNGEISTFNYYGGELTGYDSDYAGASGRFETKASLFTSAVEAFKKQLSTVSPAK